MRRRRLLGWLFLALGGLLASAFVAIQPATASVTPPITVVVTSNLPDRTDIEGPGQRVSGTFDDPANPGSRAVFDNHFAGLIKVTIPGTQGTSYVFCIEISVPLLRSGEHQAFLDERDWDTIGGKLGQNLPKVAYILNKYGGNATTNANEAASIQAAIWHYSDGFTLDSATSQTIKDRTDAIVADAEHNTVPQPPTPKLSLKPDTQSGKAGQEVGPYTVSLAGAPTADLAVTGAEARNCTTHAVVTTVADGDKVCLFRATAGTATMTASVIAAIPSGRVFDDKTVPRQKIVLANAKPIPLSANASAEWTTVEESTTTTTVHKTTTTVRPTTTTVAPTTSTTAQVLAITETPPQQGEVQPAETQPAETLPLTGSTHRPLPLAVVALTFMLLGALLIFGTRLVPAFAFAGHERPTWAEWTADMRRNLPWWLRRSHQRG